MSDLSLRDQVAVVTGGGRGLGRAHCLELARRGASVVVNDRSGDHAASVTSEIKRAGGAAVESSTPVGTSDSADEIVQLALATFGDLHIVVNNAGYTRFGSIDSISDEMLDEILAVHLRGAYFLTRSAWPVMRRNEYGRVVMTSSTAGLFGMKDNSNYGAAKGGLYGLTRSLAYDGRALGIKVNAVLPLALTTIHERDPVGSSIDRVVPAALEAHLAPRRIPEAVAPFVAYLVSPECAVSGEAFTVGCGRFARVVVGEAPGWVADDATTVTTEDIDEHFAQIMATEGFVIPTDHYDWLGITEERIYGPTNASGGSE